MNHALVRLAAYKVDPDIVDGDFYLVLGDDVVIAGKDVADNYIDLMNKLGVGISMSKRVTPIQGFPTGVEFASRFIRGNDDLSPLPLGLIHESSIERLFSLWDRLLQIHGKSRVSTDYTHGPDFGHLFPLKHGFKGYEDLVTI